MEKEKLITIIKNGKGITHPATFHADEVLSTCLLRLINPNFKVVRSNVIQNDYNGLVYDIGLGEYDHHQCNAKIRENGIKYAAFGLLWKDLSWYFMDNFHADLFDKVFVSEIDRCDNGSDTNLLSSSISLFNPAWNEEKNQNELFEKTVKLFTPILNSLIYHFKKSTFVPRYYPDMNEVLNESFCITYSDITNKKINIPIYSDTIDLWEKYSYDLIKGDDTDLFVKTFLSQVNRTYGTYKTSPFILAVSCARKKDKIKMISEIMKRRINSINSLTPAREKCEEIYNNTKDKDLIILDQYIPIDSITEKHEDIKAIIFPSDRIGYTLLCANMSPQEKERNGFKTKKVIKRIEFPTELRGKDEEFLNNYHQGLFFVHPAGYMASCYTLEQTKNLYKKIWKK